MHLIAKAISIWHGKFHCNRLKLYKILGIMQVLFFGHSVYIQDATKNMPI